MSFLNILPPGKGEECGSQPGSPRQGGGQAHDMTMLSERHCLILLPITRSALVLVRIFSRVCSVALLGPDGAPTCHLVHPSTELQLLLAAGVIHAACCCAGWPGKRERWHRCSREGPSRHYSVATSTTETPIHRLSHFTGFHEIRSPGSHAPQDRGGRRCKEGASCIIQKDYCASISGDFEAWEEAGLEEWQAGTTDCIPFCLSMTKLLMFVFSSFIARAHSFMCDCSSLLCLCFRRAPHRNVTGTS